MGTNARETNCNPLAYPPELHYKLKRSQESWKSFEPNIHHHIANNMLTKYQISKFIDFCEVWFLPESVDRIATIVGDHRCHTPLH
ncbi:hypothetical protein TNCV_484341 [Trichonephila clavipes]|nr:hypothetical protein TNCV_484341 [Trichonephila clavipes]